MSKTKIIKLNNYFNEEDIEEFNKEDPTFSPNGFAIAIGKGSGIDIAKSLMLVSNTTMIDNVKKLKINRDLNEVNKVGEIDYNSRDFMIKYANFNEWFLNSTSMRHDFTEIKEFDKIELKAKLLAMASLL